MKESPAAPINVGRPEPGLEASVPRYYWHGNFIYVISPVGDRVTLYNFETKKSDSLELSGTKDDPLTVTPVFGQNLVALAFNGQKVTKIAVADAVRGRWHAQVLSTPIEGRAVPIVTAGVAVYALGREVYAFSAEAQRWDVARLPEGIRALPSVSPETATIESDGHIYTFAGKNGKWSHVDVRALLEGSAAKK